MAVRGLAAGIMCAFALALALPASAQAGRITIIVFLDQVASDPGAPTVPGVRILPELVDREQGKILIGPGRGDTIVVSNPGGPGLSTSPSRSGLPDCTRSGAQVFCPAAGLEAIEFTGITNDDVIEVTAPLVLFARGDQGDDSFTASDSSFGRSDLEGGAGNDTLIGSPNQDFLVGDGSGQPGNDTLLGKGGPDIMTGGPGSDLVDGGPDNSGLGDSHAWAPQVGPAVITLGDGLCNDGTPSDTATPGTSTVTGCSANGVDRDLVRDVEFASGTQQNDDITGGPTPEFLSGLSGNDDIEGGLGADTMRGNRDTDLLTARDGIVDTATQCGEPGDLIPGDRAVADPDDPIDPSCTTIERGAFGTPGPVGTPPGEITPNVPSNGSEGPGPGGGDGGLTPPQLEITSPNATVKKGIAELRIRCVYLAQACVGEIELTAKKDTKAGEGKKKVEIEKGDKLGDQSVSIPWGTSEPTLVKVSKDVKKLFKAGAEQLKATAVVTARDGAAGPGAAEATVKAPVNLGAPGR